AELKDALAGRRPLRRLFTKRQRAFFSAHAPDGLQLDDLAVLGPINVLKLKFTPEDHGRRLVAELWTYPEGSRILELSTKCEPTEAFEVAAETRAFLARHGIDLSGEQQTKTRKALEFFASELRGGT
ncbi:MAG: adenylate cyclase, partial [Acidimicrobiales bacterium]